MTEPLILLALVDDVAAGPAHTPALGRFSHGRWQTLEWRIQNNNGFPPERWDAMCGATGILYAADAAVFENLGECFLCRCKMETIPSTSGRRYTNDDDRVAARRQSWRDSKRRKAAA